MFGADVGAGGEVGDGAGHFDYAGEGAGAQAEAVYQPLQQFFTLIIQRTESFQLLGIHLGVAEDAAAFEAFSLYLPGTQHARGNIGRRLPFPATYQGRCLNWMNP